MKSFVVSNPAEDFFDLRRVLITSPEGKTTVYNGVCFIASVLTA